MGNELKKFKSAIEVEKSKEQAKVVTIQIDTLEAM